MGSLIVYDYKNAWLCPNESICDVGLISIKIVNLGIKKCKDQTIKRITFDVLNLIQISKTKWTKLFENIGDLKFMSYH